jgi:hypothetical protein
MTDMEQITSRPNTNTTKISTEDAPERPHFESETLPGLGNAQILPDWVHNWARRIFKRPTPSH